ncbi:MAG TPA: DUF4240 domain-containing protein [Gammaproteobacteria bacterium]|nr:DUF4240 domain-containing protein [Gammaproteobacteria bacterium]
MDEPKFWSIVQHAHDESDGDMDEKCEAIKNSVAGLPKEEAIAFSRYFDEMMDKAYSWPLWAAAYIINGGCGDDSFSDFRASLISRGHQSFESAIANPESLVDEEADEDTLFYEGYQYAVTDGVETSAGFVPDRVMPHPDDPSGKEWEEEKVYELFPKLSAKYA